MNRNWMIVIVLMLAGCTGNHRPDISNVRVDLEVVRFERDFFNMDTNAIAPALQTLYQQHPAFGPFFTEQILGIPAKDSSAIALQAIRRFLHDYQTLNEKTAKQFEDFTAFREEVVQSMKHIRYYFPEYVLPEKLYTFIGPLDAYAEGRTGGYGDIITPDGLGVGLQLHLGADEPIYHTQEGLQLYPEYISRKFDPAMIAVNCTKNMIDDLFPGLPGDRSLLDIMVDKGKRMYLLDLFMPDTHDTLKTGYTGRQLEGAVENEALIWNFFLENQLLYVSDPQRIRDFIGDGPKTMELGDGSPGHISLFCGRQIVRAYMEKYPETRPADLLKLDGKKLLEGSGYRPRI
jgi:hypothetical protein